MGDLEQSPSIDQLLEALRKSPALVALVRVPDLVYEFANDAYAAAVRPVGDPVGKRFGESGNDGAAASLAALRRVYETGEEWSVPELRLVLAGAGGALEEMYYDVRFLPVRQGSEVRRVLIHSYDVTALVRGRLALAAELYERKRAEREREALQERLLQVQKVESLGVLAGGVAHDFNNMLTAIMGSVSAAAMTLPLDSRVQPLLAEALDGARRAADLTRQLLTFAGHTRSEKRPIDLSAHVRDVAHLLEKTLPSRVTLALELAPDLPAVDADPAQMQQVVMNLLINAGEAIRKPHGRVSVSTRVERTSGAIPLVAPPEGARPEQYVVLEVRDDGEGMDEATAARIFDPFFSTKGKGATPRGLGLASVMGILRAHGGGIRVESAPGRGTAFRVFLPPSARAAQATAPQHDDGGWRGDGSVLVVDDDLHVRAATRQLLELVGFTVLEAPDGASALRAFSAHPELRLVLLDATMPEMSGEEVIRELRRLRPGVPVVVVSGDAQGVVMQRFGRDQPGAWLAKPFTVSELVEVLRRILSR